MTHSYDVVILGAGHNGVACACYRARAALKMLVLEMTERIGGAVHSAETIRRVLDIALAPARSCITSSI